VIGTTGRRRGDLWAPRKSGHTRALPQTISNATVSPWTAVEFTPGRLDERDARALEIGQKCIEAGRRGRPSDHDRDLNMALEFLRLKKKTESEKTRPSDTALKKSIGAQFKLARSATIEAIERGIELGKKIRQALAISGQRSVCAIAEQFGVKPNTVQRISQEIVR
jgi:hypothetical protein